jgi:MEMO1 family protein
MKFIIKTEEQKFLLEVARARLYKLLGGDFKFSGQIIGSWDEDLQNVGAFVTLYVKGDLRGCVGQMKSDVDIESLIKSMAVSAATRDSRFKPILLEELGDLTIEISIVSEMKSISSIDEFDISKHGIYIKKGSLSGTFLPQVAKETAWDKEELLGRCSRDKAGIGWDGWKTAKLFIYEVFSFSE